MQHPNVLQHEPKPGSFWHGKVGLPSVRYVHAEDDPKRCIGEVVRTNVNKYRWRRYKKPVPLGTTAKERPEIVESHTSRSVSQALWALQESYRNATV